MKKTFLIILITLSFIPSISKAEDKYTLLEPLPCISGVGDCAAGTIQPDISINNYILYVYKFSIALAIFLAIVMIIWGGFLYITSEVPFIKSDGKSKIQNAVTGLIMVLVSYLILQTIDPRLVNINANLPNVGISSEMAKELQSFNSELSKDLNTANAELSNVTKDNSIKRSEITSGIADLEKEKVAIDGNVANGQMSGSEGIQAKNSIDDKIRDSKNNLAALNAQDNGIRMYSVIIDLINSGDESAVQSYTGTAVQNPTDNTSQRPVTSGNKIQVEYNKKINDILLTNTGFDKVQNLEKQRDFLIAQAEDAKRLKVISTITDTNMRETKLKEKLKAYEADARDMGKASASGFSSDQYMKIIQTKTAMAATELNKNP